MSFPAPSTPQVIHIFVDDFNININSAPALPLIDQGTTGWNNFYTQLCQPNCVNTLSIYDTRSVLPGKSSLVGNFIELGKTTYGICEVAGSVNPYDIPDGTDYVDRIITHNTAQSSNQNRKYDYITLENEYWNFNPGSSRNPLVSGLSSYLATTNVTNTTVNITPSGINGTSIQTGYMIEVNGEYRQIISIGTSTITVDRPFTIASGPTSFTVVNNQTYYDLDFDTFLYRVKNVIRPLALANNLKIEAYIGRNSEAYWTNAFRRIIPHLDRLLIEVEQNVSGFRYNEASNSARNAILKCSATRTGTITINGNTIFGTGTDFANDLGIKTRIYCNGQIFTILSINTATQQATTLETASPNITTQSTYTTYFDYAPIIYSNMTSVATWLSSTPKLSYLDAYKFFSQSGYSVGAKIQGGTAPLSVNAETVANVQNSANLVGISLYARVLNMDDVQPNIVATNSQIPCPTCGVTPPSASSFTIQTSSTNPTCNNAANGSITTNFNTAGLTSPYIYTYVNGSTTYQVTTNTVPYTFSGLGTGTWAVTVSDSAGTPNVSNTSSVNLTATFLPTWSAGANNITFNLVGGYNNYYIGQTDSSFTTYTPGGFFQSNLTSASYTYSFVNGTYYFVIGDTDGCVLTGITITVTSSGGPGLTLVSTQQPTCASSANGVITVNATGTGPFTYTFSATTGGGGSFTSPPTNATTYTYSNAIAGTWSVTVTTAAGVSAPVLTTLSYNFSSSITSTIGNNVCFSIAGGNAPFTITSNSVTPAINNTSSSTTPCLNNLLPGSYTFFVNDVSGCTVGPLTTTISAQTLSLNVLSTVNPNCDVTNNGQINVSAVGGIAPFIYSAYNTTTNVYAPTNTNGQFTNLSPGVWLITVRDSVNTTTTLSVTLTNLFYANITTTSNSICVIASGGTLGSYYVNVNGTSFPYIANTLTCYSANCGTNTVTVVDTNNVITACSITENVIVTCPFGFTYSAISVSCNNLLNGSLIVTASGGTPPYQYSISNPLFPPTLNNFTGLFNNLGRGNWTIVVNDSLGNSASTIVNLNQNFYANRVETITGYCITVSGGVTPYLIEIIDFLDPLNSINYTANTDGEYCFQRICNRVYNIRVTDNSGCLTTFKSRPLPCPSGLTIGTVSVIDPTCSNLNDGSITVSGSGGSLTYTYSALTSNTLYSTNSTGIFTGLSGGTWTIFVQDTFGSTASTNVTLFGNFEPEIYFNPIANTGATMCVRIPVGNTDFPYILNANNQTFYILNNNLNCYTLTGFTGCVKTVNYNICNVLSTCCFASANTIDQSFYTTINLSYSGIETYLCVTVDSGSTSGVTYLLTLEGNEYTLTNTQTEYCFQITGCGVVNYSICEDFTPPLVELIYSFSGGTDAIYPELPLELGSDGYIYGVTQGGGYGGYGAIFRVNPFNNQYSLIYSFSGGTSGATPLSGVMMATDGNLYGTAVGGGLGNRGIFYKFNPSNSNFEILRHFNYPPFTDTVTRPRSGLIQASGTTKLYGMGSEFPLGWGYYYDFVTSASTPNTIFGFSGVTYYPSPTNPNGSPLVWGAAPKSRLFQASDGNLYGTTTLEGIDLFNGTFFRYNITTSAATYLFSLTNSIGFNGYYTAIYDTKLVQPSGSTIIFGNTYYGGYYGYGTIYGYDFITSATTVYHDFNATFNGGYGNCFGSIFLGSDNKLYGPINEYGSFNGIFKFDPITSGFTIEYDFSNFTPTAIYEPSGQFTQFGNKLYGTSKSGGQYGLGTFYSFLLTEKILGCCYSGSVNTLTDLENRIVSVTPSWDNNLNLPLVCTSIITSGNSNVYQLSINGFTEQYDPNQEPYCMVTSGCGLTNLEVCSIYLGYGSLIEQNFGFDFFKGIGPYGSLVKLPWGIFIGVTSSGGATYGTGTIFTYTEIDETTGNINVLGELPGFNCYGSLMMASNGLIYGMSVNLGALNAGGIFTCDFGGNINIISEFSGNTYNDSGYPYGGGLIESSSGILYGMTTYGGSGDTGTIFTCDTTGNRGVIHQLDLNTDGAYPYGILLEASNGFFYGTTSEGGLNNLGTIFTCSTSGNFGVIHVFDGSNGGYPYGSLIESSNGILYGMTSQGGLYNLGTIFTCSTSGNFGVIYNFQSPNGTKPFGSLYEASNGLLYGLTNSDSGGFFDNTGKIFSIEKTGNNYQVLQSFIDYSFCLNGCNPIYGNNVIEGDYGLLAITYYGGSNNNGTIVRLSNITGCCYTTTVDLYCSQPLTVTTLSANTACGGNGLIKINITGGTPNYLVQYTNGIFSSSFISGAGDVTLNNLTASTWTVTVTDTNGVGTSVTNTYNLGQINTTTSISTTGICVTYSGFNSPYQFFIDGVLRQTVNSTGTTVCLSASCGTNHILRILDGKSCNYYESFSASCQPLELGLLYTPRSSCLNTQGGVGLSATGGSPTYNYTLVDLTNGTTYTGSSNGNVSIIVPAPTFGHSYYAYVIDSFGTSADTAIFDFAYATYGDISFAGGYVYATYSANSASFLLGGYNVKLFVNNVLVYSQNNAPFSGGTIQYPIPCGTNVDVRLTETFSIQDVIGTTTCTYTATTFYPCDLGCRPLNFERPCCDQASNGSINVTVTGGTAPFTYILTGPTGTFSATTNVTSTNFLTCQIPVVMGMCGTNINAIISGGTYTVTVIDANGDTCSQTVSGIPYLNASFTANTNEICVYIDDGPCTLGTYSISVDGVIVYDYVNKTNLSIPANTVVCFTATCGTHNIQILAPFSPNGSSIIEPCQLNYTVTVPCLTLGCNITYVNPTCDQNLNGSIGVSVTGGTGQYNYTLSSATGTVYVWPSVGTFSPFPHSFSNLGIGTYILTVIDQNGNQCINTIILDGTFNVTAPLTSTTYNTICLDISGGLPPYDIFLNNNLRINNTSSAGTYCLSASCGSNNWSVTDSATPNCLISGTTFVPCAPDLILTLISFTDPGCEGSPGEIIVSATSGTPPYSYTATNGTDIFVNNTGIFTNLNSGTWYLSVSDINFIDSIPPITLTNTFFINVQTNSNSLCVTITGGTDPYTVIVDGTSYTYNTAIIPNCYSVSGCGTSTITIIDSGSGS